jgi:diketogulonate reductase-like aldo/keto reductase
MQDQKWLTTSAGVKMPWIIYGTAWKKDRTADLVVKAIQAGFRGIDTATGRRSASQAEKPWYRT